MKILKTWNIGTIEIQMEAINRYEKNVDELLGENYMLKKQKRLGWTKSWTSLSSIPVQTLLI